MRIVLHAKYPLFLSDFNETFEFSQQIFEKSSNIKFHTSLFSGHFAAKIYYYEIKSSLPISTEAPCPKIFLFFKILTVSKFWKFKIFLGPFLAPFGLWGYYPLFQNSFMAWGLTTYLYPDVSTTFPASFFAVMPKGLTIVQSPGLTEAGLILLHWNLFSGSRVVEWERKYTHDEANIRFTQYVNAHLNAWNNTSTEWSRLVVICSTDSVAPFTLNTY